MKEKTKLERDIDKFCELYPSFKYYKNYNKIFCYLIGDLDVCDLEGNYYETFRIKIYINKDKYPYATPKVQEITEHIKRTDDNHIDEEGLCCLDIEHILEKESRKGADLMTFYKNKIYPFFTNYIFKKKTGNYANGEYAHFFDGVVQYYKEELGIDDFKVITNIIYSVASNSIPNRNELCLCGSDLKIKKCHLIKINALKSLSNSRLISDLINFEKFVNTNYSKHFISNKQKRTL
tara:strand:+ start:7005 stop:7709 length:705 start_codon:yes stop_codon:yes gene_type:complete